MNRKQELQTLQVAVQVTKGNYDTQQIIRWLDLLYEDAKDALVDVAEAEFVVAQAKARTIRLIRNKIVQPSLAESQAPYINANKPQPFGE